MLKVNNLNVHYGVINAVKNVTFDVNEGEIVALIGANGAGKTTLIKSILNIIRSDKGNIKIFEKDIKINESEIKENIGDYDGGRNGGGNGCLRRKFRIFI